MNTSNETKQLTRIVDAYPPSLQGQRGEIARFAFNVALVRSLVPAGGSVCDIGGGWGTFSLGCAAVGLQSVLIDDFGDHGFGQRSDVEAMRRIYDEHGVDVRSHDVLAPDFTLGESVFDAITSFDSMEHWHRSPRRLFRTLLRALKPGGVFVLATPNCVNLRKRITVPLGRGKWSAMSDWYEQDQFRGHVREPDLEDLLYIANDIGLSDVKVIGRNWSGYATGSPLLRALMPAIDRVLRARPTLCSDLYLIGRRAARG
jgi:2-polyprenyl-3-methyl-5-hydroxy-6-metoxy-1,4-benzoquinol methylase